MAARGGAMLYLQLQQMELKRTYYVEYVDATYCHTCGKDFKDSDANNGNYKVRDHDHMTGEYRGAAHNKCNINYFMNRFLTVVMHNLKEYDGHLILKNAYEAQSEMIGGHSYTNAIPTSLETIGL